MEYFNEYARFYTYVELKNSTPPTQIHQKLETALTVRASSYSTIIDIVGISKGSVLTILNERIGMRNRNKKQERSKKLYQSNVKKIVA